MGSGAGGLIAVVARENRGRYSHGKTTSSMGDAIYLVIHLVKIRYPAFVRQLQVLSEEESGMSSCTCVRMRRVGQGVALDRCNNRKKEFHQSIFFRTAEPDAGFGWLPDFPMPPLVLEGVFKIKIELH